MIGKEIGKKSQVNMRNKRLSMPKKIIVQGTVINNDFLGCKCNFCHDTIKKQFPIFLRDKKEKEKKKYISFCCNKCLVNFVNENKTKFPVELLMHKDTKNQRITHDIMDTELEDRFHLTNYFIVTAGTLDEMIEEMSWFVMTEEDKQ